MLHTDTLLSLPPAVTQLSLWHEAEQVCACSHPASISYNPLLKTMVQAFTCERYCQIAEQAFNSAAVLRPCEHLVK